MLKRNQCYFFFLDFFFFAGAFFFALLFFFAFLAFFFAAMLTSCWKSERSRSVPLPGENSTPHLNHRGEHIRAQANESREHRRFGNFFLNFPPDPAWAIGDLK